MVADHIAAVWRDDAKSDIHPYVDLIFEKGNSAAFIGVLVNIAKYDSTLLSSFLKPLLGNPTVFVWDSHRTDSPELHFDSYAHAKAGEYLFSASRDWCLAEFRRRTLVDVVIQRANADDDLATDLKGTIATWKSPSDPKQALEFRMLCATLDRDNYTAFVDPTTGKTELGLTYPDILQREIGAYNNSVAVPGQHLRTAVLEQETQFRCVWGHEL